MRPIRFVTAACAAAVCLPAVFVGGLATGASASPAPLTIALSRRRRVRGRRTTPALSSVFNAAIEAQNAKGGVNGHKLVPLVIDDQTNPTSLADRGRRGHLERRNRHRGGHRPSSATGAPSPPKRRGYR